VIDRGHVWGAGALPGASGRNSLDIVAPVICTGTSSMCQTRNFCRTTPSGPIAGKRGVGCVNSVAMPRRRVSKATLRM